MRRSRSLLLDLRLTQGLTCRLLAASSSSSADAVVTAASTSHLPSVQAILAGFAARRAKSGAVGVLIHTVRPPHLASHPFSLLTSLRLHLIYRAPQSGAGIFATGDARGLAPSPTDPPFSDLDVGRIERLGDSHPQRKVHLAIVAAASKGDVRSAIVLPSTIFGRSAERGAGRVFNGHSNQMPALIRASIKRGRAGLVGKYENTCASRTAGARGPKPRRRLTLLSPLAGPLVHTDDLTDLFQLALEAVLHGNAAGTGRDGFYVAENGRYVGRDAAARVGEALCARGLAQTAEPSAFSADELEVGWGAYVRLSLSLSLSLLSRSVDICTRSDPPVRLLCLAGRLCRDQLASPRRPLARARLAGPAHARRLPREPRRRGREHLRRGV